MARLRKHYAQRGFSPGALIRKGIEQQLPSAFAQSLPVPTWWHLLTAGLIVGGWSEARKQACESTRQTETKRNSACAEARMEAI